jgi:hypothetical protein
MKSIKVPGAASFLDGGIAARHLPAASVTVFGTRRGSFVQASGTQGADCSLNQHIPACQVQTSDCHGGGPAPTGPFCPTGDFVAGC